LTSAREAVFTHNRQRGAGQAVVKMFAESRVEACSLAVLLL